MHEDSGITQCILCGVIVARERHLIQHMMNNHGWKTDQIMRMLKLRERFFPRQ